MVSYGQVSNVAFQKGNLGRSRIASRQGASKRRAMNNGASSSMPCMARAGVRSDNSVRETLLMSERMVCNGGMMWETKMGMGKVNRRGVRRGRCHAADDDSPDVESNPLFSAQFMGVLQQSLARQGTDALMEGPEADERSSAMEEVLETALGQSKQQLRLLLVWRNQLDSAIKAQEKQVDRMEFALNKARNDAAYMKALKEMAYGNNSD